MPQSIEEIASRFNNDKNQLLDMLIEIQSTHGFVSEVAVKLLAEALRISTVDVEQTRSFYHFLSDKPTGKYAIYLNSSVVANLMGRERVAKAMEEEAGCRFGEVNAEGSIGLFNTSCIGMNDQEPAAIIDGTLFTRLTPMRAVEIISGLKRGLRPEELIVESAGDGRNNSKYLKTMVSNNIRRIGAVIFSTHTLWEAIKKTITLTPEDTINEIERSRLRGRGGAGFPTATKWALCRSAHGEQKYIFCNADEGEPGTFKDRVILTEKPEMIFEGMLIAAFAIGAKTGILYVRYEYKYLEKHLQNAIRTMREQNLLGKDICGLNGFDFEIQIKYGAGAYVCGEESALIESAEGKRGEPRDRPPFPAESGYLGFPTVINNVETLCSIVKIITLGADWYTTLGTTESTGTKVLSLSGDCKYPGIYEIEWGFSINDIIAMCGAEDTAAVQVGGPSGALIGRDDFERILAYEDLSTGGSLILFNSSRDLLGDIVLNFTEFFKEESCGSCVPCRTLTGIAATTLKQIVNGNGEKEDISRFEKWGRIMQANRCGLGQTAMNPILTSLKNFRELYEQRTHKSGPLFKRGGALENEINESVKLTWKST